VRYEITSTQQFDKWFDALKDKITSAHILLRLERVSKGNLGDHKVIDGAISELRFTFGPG